MCYEIKNLCKKYDTEVIDNFNINFLEHEHISLLGPSGCGKTTLINIISGILKPDSGEIKGFYNKKISFVFQEDRLLPWLTAFENVLAVKNDAVKALELFKAFELTSSENKFPSQLSGGMRQRVSLIRAIMFDGDIFILDEPFKGLDEKLKQKVMNIIKNTIKNKLCIFITHSLEEAYFISDKIIYVSGTPLKIEKIIDISKFKSIDFFTAIEKIRKCMNLKENV